MVKKYKVLQPMYVKNFKCIGSDCTQTCCGNWQINIDKNTYQRYEKYSDVEWRKKFTENIICNPNSINNDDYAEIRLTKDNMCPFLNNDNLCDIQLILGEEYLSVLCAAYPRKYNLVNGTLEKSLFTSCPESAKMILLNTGLMEFELIEQDIDLAQYPIGITIANSVFEKIRFFIISTLQNRRYPLWQRLVILGLFCDKLDKLIKVNKNVNILDLIEDYQKYLEQGIFQVSLELIPKNLIIQTRLTARCIAYCSDVAGKENKIFREHLEQALQGLDYSVECSEEENSAKYVLAYENFYRPVADKNEYILENYLVNYVFTNLFPIVGKKSSSDNYIRSVFDNYIMLITDYAVIKTLLIGIAGFYKEEFNTGHMVSLIQSCTGNTEHSNKYLQSVFEFLKNNNFDNMAYMSILIKN